MNAEYSTTGDAPLVSEAPAAASDVPPVSVAPPAASDAPPASDAPRAVSDAPPAADGVSCDPMTMTQRPPRTRTSEKVSSTEAAALERERWMRRFQKVKERSEADHVRALTEQRDQLMRAHQAQLRSLSRDHDDQLRRTRLDARSQNERLRVQLAEAQRQLSAPSELMAHDVKQLREEKQKLEHQLQEVVESDRGKGDLIRQTQDKYEHEIRKNEKQNKNKLRLLMGELSSREAEADALRREVYLLRSSLDGTSAPGYSEVQMQAVRTEAAQREARLQRELQQQRAAARRTFNAHARQRKQLERKLKRMEVEPRPSRLRPRRVITRWRPGQESAARVTPASASAAAAADSPVYAAAAAVTDIKQKKVSAVAGRQIPTLKRRRPLPSAAKTEEVVQLRKQVQELQTCVSQLRAAAQNNASRVGQLHPAKSHRLLHGKMSGLPTLREGEPFDSLEETACAGDSDISDIKPADLAELNRCDLQQLCCQLQRAHRQLRQAHELLVSRSREQGRTGRSRSRVENELLAAQSLIRDLEAALAAQGVDAAALHEKSVLTAQNLALSHRLRESRAREARVRQELSELRDLNDLMEFRILELEGCQEKVPDSSSEESPPSALDPSSAVPDAIPAHQLASPADTISPDQPTPLQTPTQPPISTEVVSPRLASLEAESLEAESPESASDQQLSAVVHPQHQFSTDISQTLEAAGEDRRRLSPPPAAIEPAAPAAAAPATAPAQVRLSEERHQWQQKIAELQSTVLQLDAELEAARSQQQQQQQSAAVQVVSSSPPPLTGSSHQRQPSGNSESELSDYHSDSNDGRPPLSATARAAAADCACGRPLCSPGAAPLQESGIFDVDCEERGVQTEVQPSELSMRELIDLSGEIARLTNARQQQNAPPQQETQPPAAPDNQPPPPPEAQPPLPSPPLPPVSACAEVQTEYLHDQLLSDYRDMCERYEKVKRNKDEVEEEKNELEEAENDARLMVQRLEMKLFASNEVEKMLSADLAEEQERCRQLQRQLNALRLRHQTDLRAARADSGSQRAEQLQLQLEQLTEQLAVAQQRTAAAETAAAASVSMAMAEPAREGPEEAMLATPSEPAAEPFQQVVVQSETVAELSETINEQSKMAETSPNHAAGSLDPAGTQLSGRKEKSAWELWRSGEPSSTDTLSSAEPCQSATSLSAEEGPAVTGSESLTRRLHEAWSFNDSGVGEELPVLQADEAPLSAPPAAGRRAKRPRTEAEPSAAEGEGLETVGDSVSSVCSECAKRLAEQEDTPKNSLDSNVSERESYYSDCIQELESQRCDMRRRWELEKTELLQRVETSCQESCELKQRLDALLAETETAKQALSDQVTQLRHELHEQSRGAEQDRRQLERGLELRQAAQQEQQQMLRRRLRAAEDALGALSVELELAGPERADSPEASGSAVLERVRALQRSHRQLAGHAAELEKKEVAYRQTLQEADRIMHNVEVQYQKKIESLEDQLREDRNRINLMEETETKLKQALKASNGKHDQERVTELLGKLIETENEDLKLKEKVYRLERRERELSIRLREEERSAEQLRLELRDQEELLRELDCARRELAAAGEQAAAAAVLRQRAGELQQSEQLLRGRLEELEQAELALRETLRAAAAAHQHKERRSAEQVCSLQQDLEQLQQQQQLLQQTAAADGEERSQLRRQLADARRQLTELQRDLDAASGTASETETQLRNEVGKLRNQLTLVNSQLTDNDAYSCQLRDQLQQAREDGGQLREQLQQQRSRAEQDLLRLNLEMSRREEELAVLSEQLHAPEQLAAELDRLSEQEAGLVRLLQLARRADTQAQSCRRCGAATDGALRSLVQELEQLSLLLSGSHSEQSLQSQLRDAENLASLAASSPSPPPPAAPAAPAAASVAVQTSPVAADAELTERISHLTAELTAKETELTLMDSQGASLLQQLELRDREAAQLRARLGDADGRLSGQRQQAAALSQLLAAAQFGRDEAAARADTKDALLAAVLAQLRRLLAARQAAALAAALRQDSGAGHERHDFDREMVCQILEQIVTVMRDRVLRSGGSTSPEQAGVSSRIPRPVPRSRENTPPCSPTKESPRCRAPQPRCLRPQRTSRHVPPVGVARPYRSGAATTPRAPPAKPPAQPLPPPDNFQIIRAVGGDSLLLYWSPAEDQRVTGYEIFVNNRLHQAIRNPQRTKALLPALRLAAHMQLAIRAVGPMDSFSALVWAEFRPGQLARGRDHSAAATATGCQ